jgi:aminoglycoside 3-N-acetyltransferase
MQLLQAKQVKNALRGIHRRARRTFVNWFLSYDAEQLLAGLRRLGVASGDALMVHAAFEPHHGFRGGITEAIDVFTRAVGPDGHLLMPSLAYHDSLLAYLRRIERFDVRKTPTVMGLMAEFFRRRPGVLRSAHPAHPILVQGPRAEWFVEGHENSAHSCAAGTPFDKLLAVGGKVAFFNVSFAHFTFFHYLEHRVAPHLGFPLYHDVPFDVSVVNRLGETVRIKAFAYAEGMQKRRHFAVLEGWLRDRGVIRELRIGASTVLLVDLREVVAAVDEMTQAGRFFYHSNAA